MRLCITRRRLPLNKLASAASSALLGECGSGKRPDLEKDPLMVTPISPVLRLSKTEKKMSELTSETTAQPDVNPDPGWTRSQL